TGTYTSYDRLYRRAGVRGFNRPGDFNFRVLVLVDGHRINDNLVNYSAVGSDFVTDINDISRVELVRGPSSSLYGSNAFFGVINVITKRGRDIQGPGITGVGGSQDTYKAKFTYGDKFNNGAELYMSASHYQSEGEDNIEVQGLGRAIDMDRENSQRGFIKGAFADFTFSGGYVSRDKRPPVPITGVTFNDPRSELVDTRAYADLTYDHTYDNGLGVMARGYYDYAAFNGFYPFVPESLNRDRFRGQWLGAELNLSKMFGDHRVSLGGEYRYNFQQNLRSFSTFPPTEFSRVDEATAIWGVFVQDEYKITEQLTLNAGVRYDQYEFVDGRFNPRIALIYQPFEDTTLKLLYGEAFRAPSIFEENYTFADTWVSSNGLKAETMRSYEVNLVQQFGKHIQLSLSPYYYQVNDIIELTGSGTTSDPNLYRNVNNISTYGLDTELNGQWQNGWRVSLGYSYQQSKVNNQSRFPENSPAHTAKINLIAPLWEDRLFAGLNVNYMSRRNTFAAKVSERFLAHFTLYSTGMVKGLELSGSIYNLFDTTFDDPSTSDLAADVIRQNGRLFMVKLNYEY
ncbi:MAG: TonB-dependent receptor plug domain-containing protein, partial [Gammaproteobacteria bacterium]